MAFANVEQIREKFLKDGWSEDTSFDELSLKDAKKEGYLFVLNEIAKGKKYFKMNANGNIYNDKGEIVLYNITPIVSALSRGDTMQKVNALNEHIELCFELWNGEITEEEFEQNRVIYISEEVDNDMQKDRFY